MPSSSNRCNCVRKEFVVCRFEQQFWSDCLICEVVHKIFYLIQALFDLCCNQNSLFLSVYLFKCYAKNMNLEHVLWLNIHCDILITNLLLQTIFLLHWRSDSTVRKLTIWAIMTWMIDCYISWEVPEDFPMKLLVDWQDFYVKFDKSNHKRCLSQE